MLSLQGKYYGSNRGRYENETKLLLYTLENIKDLLSDIKETNKQTAKHTSEHIEVAKSAARKGTSSPLVAAGHAGRM